ncbi:MAG: hypothetical protein AAF677_17450, partial [Pseudomonadota bacterium]
METQEAVEPAFWDPAAETHDDPPALRRAFTDDDIVTDLHLPTAWRCRLSSDHPTADILRAARAVDASERARTDVLGATAPRHTPRKHAASAGMSGARRGEASRNLFAAPAQRRAGRGQTPPSGGEAGAAARGADTRLAQALFDDEPLLLVQDPLPPLGPDPIQAAAAAAAMPRETVSAERRRGRRPAMTLMVAGAGLGVAGLTAAAVMLGMNAPSLQGGARSIDPGSQPGPVAAAPTTAVPTGSAPTRSAPTVPAPTGPALTGPALTAPATTDTALSGAAPTIAALATSATGGEAPASMAAPSLAAAASGTLQGASRDTGLDTSALSQAHEPARPLTALRRPTAGAPAADAPMADASAAGAPMADAPVAMHAAVHAAPAAFDAPRRPSAVSAMPRAVIAAPVAPPQALSALPGARSGAAELPVVGMMVVDPDFVQPRVPGDAAPAGPDTAAA